MIYLVSVLFSMTWHICPQAGFSTQAGGSGSGRQALPVVVSPQAAQQLQHVGAVCSSGLAQGWGPPVLRRHPSVLCWKPPFLGWMFPILGWRFPTLGWMFSILGWMIPTLERMFPVLGQMSPGWVLSVLGWNPSVLHFPPWAPCCRGVCSWGWTVPIQACRQTGNGPHML